jgi:hypothetical protein
MKTGAQRGWEKGDRVVTATDGAGAIVGPWLSRGLTRHGDLNPDGWIVALDSGKRRIYIDLQPEPAADG